MNRRLVVLAVVALAVLSVGVVAVAHTGGSHSSHATPTTTTKPDTIAQSSTTATRSTLSTTTTTTAARHAASSTTPSTSRATTSTAAPRGSLAGKVITINPGHDGGNATHSFEINQQVWIGTNYKACDTVGTESNSGYPEHAFNWTVSLLVRAQLEALGATVVFTRPDDTGWGPCIDRRAQIGNDAHSAAVVSIHADGGPASGRGFFVIANDHTPGISQSLYDASGQLASSVRDAVRAGTAMPTSNYAGSDGFMRSAIYGGLNLSTVPAIFIECGNMRNATDAALLESPTYQSQLASAIVAGIVRFVG